jgi:hypothetical protein
MNDDRLWNTAASVMGGAQGRRSTVSEFPYSRGPSAFTTTPTIMFPSRLTGDNAR